MLYRDPAVAIAPAPAYLIAALAGLLAACSDPASQTSAQDASNSVRGVEPSLQQVQAEFEAFLETANACASASECATIRPDCPLGCFAAVRQDRVQDAEAKARELIAAFSLGGRRSCVYNCPSEVDLTCTSNRCAVNPRRPADAASGAD